MVEQNSNGPDPAREQTRPARRIAPEHACEREAADKFAAQHDDGRTGRTVPQRGKQLVDDAIGFEAIAEVQPGGHFFSAGHTMARYRTAFYEPLVADWSNFGNWTQSGSKTASERATGVWRRTLADFAPPATAVATAGVLDEFIARRTAEGGAAPVS